MVTRSNRCEGVALEVCHHWNAIDNTPQRRESSDRDRDAKEGPVDLLGEASVMGTGLHRKEVQVAIWSALATPDGAEKDDLIRLCH